MNKQTGLLKKYFIIIILFMPIISCEDFLLGPDPENTPINNFEILWKEFDRYYPTFIVYKINWDSLHDVYKNMISSNTTEEELWDVITSMLSNLNDAHVSLYNNDGTKYFNSSYRFFCCEGEFSLDLIKNKYLHNQFKTAGDGNFTYGKFANDSIGYIHISTFNGDYDWVKDIDKIILYLYDVKSIMLDIRNNRGGFYNILSYAASNFTDKSVAYSQELARNGPKHSDFSLPVFLTIHPRPPKFTKQIVLLTNRYTGSASEVFALFFTQLPYSIQIGDSTFGSLGVTRAFQLPNGWLYKMPQSLTLTIDGHCLERIGVAPDIYVKNTWQEIELGYDHTFETALEYLSNK